VAGQGDERGTVAGQGGIDLALQPAEDGECHPRLFQLFAGGRVALPGNGPAGLGQGQEQPVPGPPGRPLQGAHGLEQDRRGGVQPGGVPVGECAQGQRTQVGLHQPEGLGDEGLVIERRIEQRQIGRGGGSRHGGVPGARGYRHDGSILPVITLARSRS
jgi:hypothetical protein